MINGFNGIREVREDDDFETLSQLLRDNTDRFLETKIFSEAHTAEALRNNYCSVDSYSRGFIFEENGKVVAFAGLTLLQRSKDGKIDDWFTLAGHEHVFNQLVEQCVKIVQQLGGQKIFSLTFTRFGQLRNKKIDFWERLGFISDEYASASLTLDMDNWQGPDDFENPNLQPAMDSDIENIIQILLDDGENRTVDFFGEPDLFKKRQDHVILTLREKDTDEIVGIINYLVKLINVGTKYEQFNAAGFTIHLRPKFNPTQNQHRQLIQAALFSMKQLNINIAVTTITLKNFDTFIGMIKEGFQNNMLMEHHFIRFYKLVKN